MNKLTGSLIASLLFVGCAGTDTVDYRGKKLEPKSAVFSHVVVGGQEKLFVAISSEGNYCNEFDGLGCIAQPQTGRSLTFLLDTPESKNFGIGSDAHASFRDYTERLTSIQDAASAGTVNVENLDVEQSLQGRYELTLPEGSIHGAFNASYCKHLRDYSLKCPEQSL